MGKSAREHEIDHKEMADFWRAEIKERQAELDKDNLETKLKPARAILIGAGISVLFWAAAIGLIVWFV